MFNPGFVLCDVSKDIVSSYAKSNQAPGNFCNWAEEEQVVNTFIRGAKVTRWITRSVSFQQIILSQNNSIL
jgi:hypothetical protein